jgi:transcriptional regulator with XRE-family HTH domain
MSHQDDDFEALFREVLANPIAGAAYGENDFRRALSEAFEQKRKLKQLTMRDFAKQIGTSLSQVQRLLHVEAGGKSSVTLRTIFRAAHILDLQVTAHIRDKKKSSVGNVVSFGERAFSTDIGPLYPCHLPPENSVPAGKPEQSPWRDLKTMPDTEFLRCGG